MGGLQDDVWGCIICSHAVIESVMQYASVSLLAVVQNSIWLDKAPLWPELAGMIYFWTSIIGSKTILSEHISEFCLKFKCNVSLRKIRLMLLIVMLMAGVPTYSSRDFKMYLSDSGQPGTTQVPQLPRDTYGKAQACLLFAAARLVCSLSLR